MKNSVGILATLVTTKYALYVKVRRDMLFQCHADIEGTYSKCIYNGNLQAWSQNRIYW